MSESQLSPGTVVDGAYTLDAVVRSRAGATTYVATDSRDGGTEAVWVTIYEGDCFPSGLALERSLRELRQLKNINSPRVLRVLDAGKHGDGIFEVTEPGPAHTLVEHLQQGALSLEEAAALTVQVGEALLEGQRVGVIHRNLGADVVFPSPEGARVSGFAVGEPQSRGAGPLLTIAPEQVQGKVVDQRTLIYNVAALMQWMLSGTPLFSGSPDDVLAAHENQVPDESIDAKLRRALGKDPRMRPMMLKQFLSDIANMGGVEPPRLSARVSAPNLAAAPKAPVAAPKAPDAAVARPSSRGWTMFMQAQEEEPEKPAEPAPPPSKPSTRGWTMFMKAQDDPDGADAKPEETPAEPAAPQAEGAPSTRGWTMFMKNEEAGGDASSGQDASPGQDAPAEQAGEPAAEGSPSTRGWTMFTKDEEAAEPEPEPVPEPDPAPEPEPAPAPAADGSPSTRGWTMFTKDEDEPASDEAPAAPAAEAEPSGAPSSRGWTMFMEPGEKPAEGAVPASQPAPPEVDDESASEPGAPKKRGWTMFMNAPLEDLPKGEAAESKPVAPNVEAADQKGWTVFGAPAPGKAGSAPAPEAGTVEASTETDSGPVAPTGEPVRGKTIMVTTPSPVPAGGPAAEDVPDAAAASAPTVVNTGPPGGTPVEKGKTIVAGAKPDTMYFKKGEVEPEGGVSPRAPTVRDVPSPSRPVEERVARADARPTGPSVPAVPEPAALEPTKSSNTALYAIAGAVAVAAAVAAYFAFT